MLLVAATTASSLAWADADPTVASGVLRLQGGDFVAGRLMDSADPDWLEWQNPAFDTAFRFPFPAISEIAFAAPASAASASGEFGMELTSGDRLYGSIVGIDDDTLTMDSPELGNLEIDREMLRRLFRWNDGETLLYNGPGDLDDWRQTASDQGGSLYNDIRLPPQSRIELELSWHDRPNFVLSLGVDRDPETSRHAFRVEVWNDQLVLLRELEEIADVVSIGSIADFDGHLRISIALDQAAQRAAVYSDQGAMLADLQLSAASDQSLPGLQQGGGLRLESIEGDVRLDALRVFAGRQLDAAAADSDQGRIELVDGEVIQGRWIRIENDVWIVAAEGREHRVDPRRVLHADFAAIASGAPASPTIAHGPLRLTTYGGMRVTGQLEKIADRTLYLRVRGIDRPLRIQVDELRNIVSLVSDSTTDPPRETSAEPAGDERLASASRIGRLELEDTRLHGRLVAAPATEPSSGLWFSPIDAPQGAALRSGASGRLIFRGSDAVPIPPQQSSPARQGAEGGILGPFAAMFGGERASSGGGATAPATIGVQFRGGDVLPCHIHTIDEAGVAFESPIVGATGVPHDQIRAVTLTHDPLPEIDLNRRQRLLTVPRMRKQTPPTQLLISTDGDFLRGRLIALDEERLTFESGLETIEIPRRVVAQILWFHADELPDEPSSADGAAARLRVQSVHRDGVRLTFHPQQLGGGELIGESPLLGICLVNLADVEQLLFGGEIEADARRSPYQQWRLVPAAEPKMVDEQLESGAIKQPRRGDIE